VRAEELPEAARLAQGAGAFLAEAEALRRGRKRPARGREANDAILPPEGKVFYGCRAWEPRYDASAVEQHRDGRHRFGNRRRKKKRCVCGSGRGRIVQVGSLYYCEGCAGYGQEFKLPTVLPIPDPPAPTVSAFDHAATKGLSRRLKRRAKFGGRRPASP
jgi:hypothetical protein